MIGAGIAGLCLARELALRHWQVLLFRDPDHGSASRAAAGLLQLAGGRISKLHLGLRRACQEYYPHFLESIPQAPQLRRDGHLRCGVNEEYCESFLSTVRGLGIHGKLYPGERLQGLTQATVKAPAAVWLPDLAIDPGQLLGALEQALDSLQVEQHAVAIRSLDGEGAVDSRGKLWSGDAIVLACGAGLTELAALPWSFHQEPGWGASYRGEISLTCSLEGRGQTLVPLSSSAWRVGGAEPWGLEPPVRELVVWNGEEVNSRTHGLRCAAPDGLPVAGLLSGKRFILGGLGRNGLLTAPLLSSGLAELIDTGVSRDWLIPFSPKRANIARRRPWSKIP